MNLEEIITKEQGIEFVNLFGDTNKIHREGNLIQGMHLAATILKSSWNFFRVDPYTQVKNLNIKLKSLTKYNETLSFRHEVGGYYNSDIKILSFGYQNGKEFIEFEMTCSRDPESEAKKHTDNFDSVHKVDVPGKFQHFCRILDMDEYMSDSEHIKKFFLASFVAGALCKYINPNKLPTNKAPVWAKQEFNFYKHPEIEISNMSIFIKKLKDTDKVAGLEESFCVDGYEIISGNSLLFKVDKNKILEI